MNSYHKPQLALNHYLQISERTSLATSAYISWGEGYGSRYDGTGTPKLFETLPDGTTVNTTWNWDNLYETNSTQELPVTYPEYEMSIMGIQCMG